MESNFVSWLGQRLGRQINVPLGVGDDCAVVTLGKQEQVVATDLLCDGVHFKIDEVAPRLIGRKALAVNLSDFAAMAARPSFALVSLLWPRDQDPELAKEIYEGLLELADEHRVAIVGGDTNRWDGRLAINVAVTGTPTGPRVWRRQDALPGDTILVSGPLGGSILGHHLSFNPRVQEAIDLHRDYEVHSAMDITDGLLIDLHRILSACNVGAELDESAIPITDAAHRLSQTSGRSPLDHAMSDGEDFELLITTDPETADKLVRDRPGGLAWTKIGAIVGTPGMFARQGEARRQLQPRGYLH